MASYFSFAGCVMSVAMIPGANLVDQNTELCKTCCKQLRQHGESRFADAVISSIGAGGVRGYRGDENDLRFRRPGAELGSMRDPKPGAALREEIRALQVRGDEAVETLFACLEEVGTRGGGNSCIIHQEMHPAEPGEDRIE